MLALMTTPTPTAGGFFLILPIVLGFVWGLISGRALHGAKAGERVTIAAPGGSWVARVVSVGP